MTYASICRSARRVTRVLKLSSIIALAAGGVACGRSSQPQQPMLSRPALEEAELALPELNEFNPTIAPINKMSEPLSPPNVPQLGE